MSGCPGDLDAVLKFLKRTNGRVITNEEILERIGGRPTDWVAYLKGPMVQAVFGALKSTLAEENTEMVSLGVHSEQWKAVTCAEANALHGSQQTMKAPNALLRAEESFWRVVADTRADPRLSGDCAAWLRLFKDDKHRQWAIFLEWAHELQKHLPPPDESLH